MHIERMLESAASIWVACNPELEDRVIGWLCGDARRGLLHWVWTREEWRRIGVARELVARLDSESGRKDLMATGWSPAGAELMRHLSGMFRAWPDCYRPDLGR
jgi:GNAT superfamily N-acetyltransferase